MPLLNRDMGRSGGSRENRRSLVEIYNSDASEIPGNAAAPVANRTNGADEVPWRWEAPGSPQAAPSPRALVPTACFPQDHPAALANFSELALPGSWATEPCEGLTDLVESFKALAAPTPAARRRRAYQTRLSCELTLESWPPEGAFSLPPEEARGLSRRSSYCERNGGAAEECRAGAGGAGGAGAGGVARTEPRLLTWRGTLPARGADASPPGGFSAKVFMGGLPWDITEETLKYALRDFQPLRVEWPGSDAVPRGFAYVTLESERRVRALLHASRRHAGKWVYRLTARDLRYKDVEVIPWALADTNWVCAEAGVGGVGGVGASSLRLEPTRTVFVGALHGVLSASALALIMNDLFSGVVYAGIDTDKSKYPIGSGRVTFNNVHSYVRAISAAYVEIRTDKFVKKIQVDPYLEDSMCSVCNLQQGPYFCREPVCFKYFCRSCWARRHAAENHKPLMRNSKIGANGTSWNAANGTNWNAANGTNWNANSSNWDAANDTNGSNWGGANGSSWGEANGSNWGGANGSNWNISKWNGANGSNWSVSNWNGSNGNGSNSDTQANATTPSPSPSTSGTSGSSRTSSGTSADHGAEPLALERLSLA